MKNKMKTIIIFILNILSIWVFYFLYSLNIFLINGSGANYNKNIEYWKIGFGLIACLHCLIVFRYFNNKIKYLLIFILLIVYFYYGYYKL